MLFRSGSSFIPIQVTEEKTTRSIIVRGKAKDLDVVDKVIREIDVRTKLKRRITTQGNYNARASYLNENEIVFVHRGSENFNIAKLDLKTRELEVLTSTQNDESPCIAPNGNVIIYSTKDGNLSYLAGVNISSKVKFKLPALYGELKEPAWSPFLR